jgi:hypothetical protein
MKHIAKLSICGMCGISDATGPLSINSWNVSWDYKYSKNSNEELR